MHHAYELVKAQKDLSSSHMDDLLPYIRFLKLSVSFFVDNDNDINPSIDGKKDNDLMM